MLSGKLKKLRFQLQKALSDYTEATEAQEGDDEDNQAKATTSWAKHKIMTRWWRRLSCNLQRGVATTILNAHFASFDGGQRRGSI